MHTPAGDSAVIPSGAYPSCNQRAVLFFLVYGGLGFYPHLQYFRPFSRAALGPFRFISRPAIILSFSKLIAYEVYTCSMLAVQVAA